MFPNHVSSSEMNKCHRGFPLRTTLSLPRKPSYTARTPRADACKVIVTFTHGQNKVRTPLQYSLLSFDTSSSLPPLLPTLLLLPPATFSPHLPLTHFKYSLQSRWQGYPRCNFHLPGDQPSIDTSSNFCAASTFLPLHTRHVFQIVLCELKLRNGRFLSFSHCPLTTSRTLFPIEDFMTRC